MTVVFVNFEGHPTPSPNARAAFLKALRLIMSSPSDDVPNPESAAGSALNKTLGIIMRENNLRHSTEVKPNHVTESLGIEGVDKDALDSLHGDYGCTGETPWLKTAFALTTMARSIETLGTEADKAAHAQWAADVDAFWSTGRWNRGTQQNIPVAAIA